MRVLLTGATGLLGPYVTAKLRADGHEVIRFVRKSTEPGDHAGDMLKPWTLWDALAGCDALVACAHIRFAPACIYACRKLGVRRYLQMSSARIKSRVHDAGHRELARGEAAIRLSGLEYTILRSTMIFDGEHDLNIARLAAWFRARRLFPLVGGGRALVQPVHAGDVAEIMARAMMHPGAHGATLPVAGGAPLPWRGCASAVCRRVRGRGPLFLSIPGAAAVAAGWVLPPGRRAQLIRLLEDRSLDIEPTVKLLGFQPRTFEEAIAAAPW